LLQLYRQQLDLLNTQLLRLLELRGTVVLSVLELKRRRNLPIHDPCREETMLSSLCQEATGPYSAGQIEQIFTCIFAASRSLGAASDELPLDTEPAAGE